MSEITSISWTESSWNPCTGCSPFSEACANCYAQKMSHRLQAMGLKKYSNGFKVTLHPDELEKPYKWKKPRMIFVCSMSDIFHEEVPDEFIHKIFKVMNDNPRHIFQVLTKRPERLKALKLNWSDNIWFGVTVEMTKYLERIKIMADRVPVLKFVSFEPLLELIPTIELQMSYIHILDWAIVGGETGPECRKMEESWVLPIMEECRRKEIPFFFKQWNNKYDTKFNGQIIQEMPQVKGA